MISERIGAIRPDPKDLSPLRIDEALVRRMLVAFLREETAKSGHKRVVVAVSGGIDSAAVAALAAEAMGPKNVTALFMPYRTSHKDSTEHARLVAKTFDVALDEIDITPQVDAYFARDAYSARADHRHAPNVAADASGAPSTTFFCAAARSLVGMLIGTGACCTSEVPPAESRAAMNRRTRASSVWVCSCGINASLPMGMRTSTGTR